MTRLHRPFILTFYLYALAAGCAPARTSPITSPIAGATATQRPQTPTPILLVVTSPDDAGPGTLRQALEDAISPVVITFDPSVFPPDAPATISLSTALPELRYGNLTIDASNAGVILDGGNIPGPESQHGLSISSDNNVIRGLQVVGFSDAGIGLHGGAQYNTIGGDGTIGDGPLGQGNLISGNANFGIGLWGESTSHNTIEGNFIGISLDAATAWGHARDGIHSNGATQNLITGNVIGGNGSAGVYLCCVLDGGNTITSNLIGIGPGGDPLGNGIAGVLIDRTRHNVVGPGNVIAHNHGEGMLFWQNTPSNTITRNSIRDNGGRGVVLESGSQVAILPPVILNFDLPAGTLSGATCAYCAVEIFSDSSDEAATFEGQTVAEENGAFTFAKGAPLAGPFLTANSTAPDGSTTELSAPTQGASRYLSLQVGNEFPMVRLQTSPSNALADNRIGASFGGSHLRQNLAVVLAQSIDLGLKRLDMTFGDHEPPIDWSMDEFDIPPDADQFIDDLAASGIAVNYLVHFMDLAGHAAGEELSTPRFQDDEQVQEFLDYVRFFVRHFKGRIAYYTIWSEPDNCNPPPIKCILPEDYIALVREVIPVIRQEDPTAKVVSAPNVLFFDRDYLFEILESDVVQLFDVISWHPIYDAVPYHEFYGNYYFEYPSIIQEIKQTASANGFRGEYWGTELTWCSEEFPRCQPADQPWEVAETDLQAAKYYARGIVMQLGLDVGVGLGGFQTSARWSYPAIRNVNTVMAGALPIELPAEIESQATTFIGSGFVLPNGEMLFALWTNGSAVEDDRGVNTTLTFAGLSGRQVVAIDVLHGFEQQVITESESGSLIVRDLLVKDYPIILRLIN